MKLTIRISEIPNTLPIEELMDLKGGNDIGIDFCSITSSAIKCTKEGSGVCIAENSGIKCEAQGSGLIIKQPGPGNEGMI